MTSSSNIDLADLNLAVANRFEPAPDYPGAPFSAEVSPLGWWEWACIKRDWVLKRKATEDPATAAMLRAEVVLAHGRVTTEAYPPLLDCTINLPLGPTGAPFGSHTVDFKAPLTVDIIVKAECLATTLAWCQAFKVEVPQSLST